MDKIHQVPPSEILINIFSSTKDLSSAYARGSLPKKSRMAISQEGKGNN